MKRVLKVVLFVLLWFNGILIIGSGLSLLDDLHYPGWLDLLLLPGTVAFVCAGLISLALTFFSRIHPWWLFSFALMEGICLAFAIPDQQELYKGLPLYVLLLGVDGWTLVIISLLLMMMDKGPAFRQK